MPNGPIDHLRDDWGVRSILTYCLEVIAHNRSGRRETEGTREINAVERAAAAAAAAAERGAGRSQRRLFSCHIISTEL